MAPSLAQAFRRKWWIAVTSVVENLMFAAVLLGWSSLLLMLKNEGFYSNLCKLPQPEEVGNGTTNITTTASSLSYNVTTKEENEILFTPSGYPTCAAQDEILNRYFTIGSCLLSGVTMILGVIMDKYGSRMIRLTGTWAFMLSCLLFALGSMDTENYSMLIAPAVCLNGMGGVVYIFTSFPVPNLFEDLRSTMISLMIGSYSASAVMYMIFKAAYDAGVPFVWLMMFHGVIGFLTFINCYFNTPGEPIPAPDDISYAIKFRFHALGFEHKITGKGFLHHTSSVGRRMSSTDYSDAENRNYLESALDLGGDKKESSGSEESFLKVLMDPCILLSFLTMSLTQLRLIAFMGWLELYLKSSAEKQDLNVEEASETVEFYTFLFGLFQINCFFMAPVIGTIMDWNLKQKKKKSKAEVRVQNGRNDDMTVSVDHESDDAFTEKKSISNGHSNDLSNGVKQPASAPTGGEHFQHTKKKQQVTNLFRAFLLTNILLTLFGILILFDAVLPLQIVSFLVHTAVRTFLHSSIGGLYACMFHFSHFGKLTGLASLLSALFILVQDPLFVVINSSLGGDPFWINVALLIFTVGGFGLPFYLWRYARNMGDYQHIESKPRKMFTISEEEEIDGFSQSSSDDEAAPMVSSLAIAL